MGKLKRSSAVKKNQKKPKNKRAKLTIEELLEHAEIHLDQFELETAFQYVKNALDIDPKHLQALELMASIQMEMGNVDSAKNIYQKLADISPNEGFSKYMCLAQLSDGIDAVNFYKKGIELMIVEYEKQQLNQQDLPTTSNNVDNEDDEQGDPNKITKLDISTAFGSIAELYLTDLCMEENADTLCKSYLDKSIEYEPKNSETLQLLASYWLSKEDTDQAKKYILESLDNWLPKYLEACEAGPLVDPAQAITLTYDSRINTSRILTEVQEYDKAITVLDQLIEEDDEIVVVWYMLGWVNNLKGEDYRSNAKFYLKKANELATKIKYEQRFLDDQLKSHISELLEQLADVKTDDEEEYEEQDKENINDDELEEDDYSSFSDDEDEETEEKDNNNNNIKPNKDSKLSNGNSVSKKKTLNNHKNLEESMDLN